MKLLKLLKRLINSLYWYFIGEVTIAYSINGKTVIISLKRGVLHRIFVGHRVLVESLTVQTGHVSNEDFNITKQIYEQQ